MSSIDTTLFVPGVARRLGHDVTAAASEAQDVRIAASRPSKVLRQQGHDRRLCPDANGVQGIDIIVEMSVRSVMSFLPSPFVSRTKIDLETRRQFSRLAEYFSFVQGWRSQRVLPIVIRPRVSRPASA